MNRTQKLNSTLRSLQAETPDVEASALITDDGLIIASALPQHIEEARVGGMSATLLSLASRAARELDLGDVEQVLVRGSKSFAVLQRATDGMLLLVMTTGNAKLGLIFLDMNRAVASIREVF